MSNRKSVGYSKKYAQAMRSFDRSVTRTTNAVSRVAFGQTKRGQTRQDLSAASGNWERTSLTNKQLIASCVVGAILPTVCLVGKDATTETTGMLLLVLFFFFAIPFLVMVLIFMVFNAVARPRTACIANQSCTTEESANEVNEPAQLYSPNPEWIGQVGLVDSRTNAQLLAPQFMKQVLESAKILQTTTEPGTFFTRYDFCVGRLMELEECKKYGVSVSTTQDLKKYRSMDFREEAVEEIIHRTQEKYQDKIERLKTQKAKQNWATKYHQAFEPFLPYMSDTAKSRLGECSAELFTLADKKFDTAESVR